jgi:hypothetical protein
MPVVRLKWKFRKYVRLVVWAGTYPARPSTCIDSGYAHKSNRTAKWSGVEVEYVGKG